MPRTPPTPPSDSPALALSGPRYRLPATDCWLDSAESARSNTRCRCRSPPANMGRSLSARCPLKLFLSYFQSPHQFLYATQIFPLEVFIQFAGDPARRSRIPKIYGTNFHRGRAGNQEFGRILSGPNSTQTNHWNSNGLRRLVHHAQSDRLNGRPRESAKTSANAGTPRMRIDRE